MIQFFRSFMNSKLGVIVTLGVLAIIAFAFAIGDVANTGTFGGITGGDRVAVVGKTKISGPELEAAVRQEFDALRRQNPTATLEGFVKDGGVERVLEGMIDRTAIAEFGKKYGIRAGSRLIDSEIAKNPGFLGPGGEFDQNVYDAALRQLGMTDGQLRSQLESSLLAQQVVSPVMVDGNLPLPLVKRYSALLRERRQGEIAILPSSAYAPKGQPTDAQLLAYYNDNRASYMRPERRVIRYATFNDAALANLAPPTEAEIAARYKRDSALYAATEKRRLTQLVLATEADARAVRDAVSKGKTLEQVARERGLATASVGPVSKSELSGQASAAVGQAAFAAARGQVSAPARGGLGFYLLRVDAVENTAGRTLDQARAEIAATLVNEKRETALADLSARIEDEFDNGASLADVAAEVGVKIETTPELLGNGTVYGSPGVAAPALIARAVSAAFEMEEGKPQLVEIEAGKTFLLFDVSQIVAAKAAPLAEIKNTVIEGWRRSEGDKLAKAAADRVMQLVAKGEDLSSALGKEKVPLPAPDQVNMSREELAKMGQRMPSVLALMFSMAEGTVKRLEAPNDNGWFVVKLKDIEPGKLAENDPLIQQAAAQLAPAVGEEYVQQFVAAVREEIGVESNKSAIEAIKKSLIGRN